MSKPKFIIYALHEEGSEELRYIGKSSYLGRPKEHFKPRSYKKNYPVNSWIKSVDNKQAKVLIKVLEVLVRKEELDPAEIRLIAEYRALGHRLTNILPGGGGASGRAPWNKGLTDCYKPEVIAIMSAAKKGRKWSTEKKHIFKCNIAEDKRAGISRMGDNLSKPVRCITDGLEFKSIKSAARHYGYFPSDLTRALKGTNGSRSRVAKDGRKFIFIEPDKKLDTGYYLGAVTPGPHGMSSSQSTSHSLPKPDDV